MENIVDEISYIMNFRYEKIEVGNFEKYLQLTSSKLFEGYVDVVNIGSDPGTLDWVGPFWKLPLSIYIGFDQEYVSTTRLLGPFSAHLWRSIILWFFVLGCTMNFLTEGRNRLKFNFIMDGFYRAFITFGQGGESAKNTTISTRMAILAGRIVGFFLNFAYSGAILSFILTSNIVLPFENFKGLVEHGKYQVYAPHIKDLQRFINELIPDYKKSAKNILINKILDDAFQRPCKDHKFAFIGTEEDYFYLKMYSDCEILKIPKPVFNFWAVLTLRYRSPYKSIFNHIINTMRSAGIIKKILLHQENCRRTWTYTLGDKELRPSLKSVTVEKLMSTFYFIGILYNVAAIIFFSELCYNILNNWIRRLKMKNINTVAIKK